MIFFILGLLFGILVTLLCVKYFRNKTEAVSDKLGEAIDRIRNSNS